MNDRRMEIRYALASFVLYLGGDFVYWAFRGGSTREIAGLVVAPVELLVFIFVAIRVSLRERRHPVLASATISGITALAVRIVKIPLTLVLPGLILRDYDQWAQGAFVEGVQIGCVAAAVAALLGAGARLFARLRVRWVARRH